MPTFSEPVDFSKQEALNFVSHKLASAPSSPVVGQRYFDTTLNKEGVYSGSSWNYTNTPTPIAGSLVNPVGVSVVDFSIPAGVRRLTLLSNGLVSAGAIVRLGTSSGVLVAEYNSVIHYYGQFTGVEASSTAGILVPKCSGSSVGIFCMTFYRVSPNGWNSTGQGRDGMEYGSLSIGTILLPGELTTFRYISQSVMNSGSLQLLWEF